MDTHQNQWNARGVRLLRPATTASLVSLALLLALAGGCASKAGRPIVDMKGVDPYQYEQDLAECSTYADEVAVGAKAAEGAVGGAVVGAAIGAIWDRHDNSVGRSAASGAVLGGAGGAGKGISERRRVVKNCLRGRGYRVLN